VRKSLLSRYRFGVPKWTERAPEEILSAGPTADGDQIRFDSSGHPTVGALSLSIDRGFVIYPSIAAKIRRVDLFFKKQLFFFYLRKFRRGDMRASLKLRINTCCFLSKLVICII
jgi:hypothetical protein